MKKFILILFLILGLSSCSASLDKEAYISSYYIDYVDDKYIVTYNLLDDEDHKTGTFSFSNLLICFQASDASIDMNINFAYVKSVILNKRMLNEKCLNDFFNLIKDVNKLSFNFYVFVTDEKAKDIYDSKKLVNTEYYYSLFNNPINKTLYLCSKPMHFLEFAREYSDGIDSLIIPSINVDKSWNSNEKLNNTVSLGVYNVNGDYIDVSEYEGGVLFTNFKEISLGDNDNQIRINKYSLRINKNLKITLKGNVTLGRNSNYKEYINKVLFEYIDECYKRNIDILNIRGINKRYNKNLTIDDINVEYNLKE